MKLNRRQLRALIAEETNALNESVGGAIAIGLTALVAFGFSGLDVYLSMSNKQKNVARPHDLAGTADLYEMFGMDSYKKPTGTSSVGMSGIIGRDSYSALEGRVEQELGSVPRRVGELIQGGMSNHDAISQALKEDEIEARKFLQAAAKVQRSPVTGLG